jgi:YidC/Oxa1 family membrane protein insertase
MNMNFFKDLFFTLLYQPLFNILFFLAWLIPGHSIGWAIIALTIIIRLILVPSTNKMLEHQRVMKVLQPKVEALKAQHGDDKAAHSAALMALYAEEKVSPFGGCVASLIQLPILWVLYQVFTDGLTGDPGAILYKFIPEFTVNTHWFGLDLTRPEPWVLPIIVGILQFIQVKQTTGMTQSTGDKKGDDFAQMLSRNMTFVVPIIAWSVARNFPAALALYYATFSLFLIIQQYLYFRMPHKSVEGQIEAKTNELSASNDKKKTNDQSAKKQTSKMGDVTVTVRKRGDK